MRGRAIAVKVNELGDDTVKGAAINHTRKQQNDFYRSQVQKLVQSSTNVAVECICAKVLWRGRRKGCRTATKCGKNEMKCKKKKDKYWRQGLQSDDFASVIIGGLALVGPQLRLVHLGSPRLVNFRPRHNSRIPAPAIVEETF